MSVILRTLRRGPRRRSRTGVRLQLEALEARHLLAVTTWPGLTNPVLEGEPNDTLDQARNLLPNPATSLNDLGRAEAVGTVGNGSAGAADVDWFRFQLDRPASVTLTTLARLGGSPLTSVLSLYSDNPNDPTNPAFAYRLLAQDDGTVRGGDARIDRQLGAGTYYVAVSGAGNRFFHPFLASSGFDGSTGDYGFLVTAADLNPVPPVLAVDPAPGATLDRSPLVIRVNLSAPLAAGQTLTLRDAGDNAITLAMTDFNAALNEMRLVLGQPLGEGSYRVSLRDAGDQELYGSSFTINAVEGRPGGGLGGNDTRTTANDLGNVTNVGLVQVTGIIGDDPFYTTLFDPNIGNQPTDTANDVDMYRFVISGPGTYAIRAEVLAGRIGSPLNPGLSLFRISPDDPNVLELVTANDDTLNTFPATQGSPPLQFDSFVFAGLTAGEYFLAVSSSFNVPDGLIGLFPGMDGVFDPNLPQSGVLGSSTGDYVLSFFVELSSAPPQVIGSNLLDNPVQFESPPHLVVQFSEPVNLQGLAFQAYANPGAFNPGELPSVFIRNTTSGQLTYPRLQSYDTATNTATFLMLDRLPEGTYELHLSGAGPQGLTDFSGNRLVGNHSSGDYLIPFTVIPAPLRAGYLGTLFPRELASGATITGSLTPGGQTEDQFRVLQQQQYLFALTNAAGQSVAIPPAVYEILPGGARKLVPQFLQGAGSNVLATLQPGTYVVRVTNGAAGALSFRLRVNLLGAADNPQPLTIGPAPAARIRLATPAVSGSAVVPPPGLVSSLLSGGNSTGITSVLLSNTPPEVSRLTSLASSRLPALAAGPVGGVNGSGSTLPSAANPVLALANDMSLLQQWLLLTILTQGGGEDATGEQPDPAQPGDISTLAREYLRDLTRFWEQVLQGAGIKTAPQQSETPESDASSSPAGSGPAAPVPDRPARGEDEEDKGAVAESGDGCGTAVSAVAVVPTTADTAVPHPEKTTVGEASAADSPWVQALAAAGAIAGTWSRKHARKRRTTSRRGRPTARGTHS